MSGVLITLLRRYLAPYRGLLALLLVLQTFQAMATLFLPSINADIVDKGIVAGDDSAIWRLGGLMLAVTLAQAVSAGAAVYVGARLATRFGRDVRSGLFGQVTGFSAREVARFGTPSLINRITNDVQQVQLFSMMTFTLLIAAPITGVGGIVMAVREDLGLSWIIAVSIPILLVLVSLVVARMVPMFREMQERIDRVNRVLREQITGIRVIRAFVREPAERERFGRVNEELTQVSQSAGRIMALMFPIAMMVINLSSITVIWVAADRIDSGEMQLGALIAFLNYLTQILISVMMATFMAVMAPRAEVCAERIIEVLDTQTSVVAPDRPVTDVPVTGTLELRGVGFHYPGADEPVLADVDLTARAGQTTAIIGSTGSGKSTLVSLIPRLFDATAGQVLVDGVDVRELHPEDLWSRIGLVPQKAFLFSGTIATNLRFGAPDATDEELWEALEVAQAADFVRSFPDGLDAPVSQGGSNLSGGQRQRVAIARALARRPGIYVFDDSFSALDLATDARLRAALAPRVRDATVVIVAQRVSTIVGADQILVLEDGRTVGLGTHEELLGTCPTYREIVASQMDLGDAA